MSYTNMTTPSLEAFFLGAKITLCDYISPDTLDKQGPNEHNCRTPSFFLWAGGCFTLSNSLGQWVKPSNYGSWGGSRYILIESILSLSLYIPKGVFCSDRHSICMYPIFLHQRNSIGTSKRTHTRSYSQFLDQLSGVSINFCYHSPHPP